MSAPATPAGEFGAPGMGCAPMKPFPAKYMDAINAYQQRIGPNAPLWSADREDMLGVAPQHDSTDPPQYWPDKAKKWLRSSLRRNPYVRKVY